MRIVREILGTLIWFLEVIFGIGFALFTLVALLNYFSLGMPPGRAISDSYGKICFLGRIFFDKTNIFLLAITIPAYFALLYLIPTPTCPEPIEKEGGEKDDEPKTS